MYKLLAILWIPFILIMTFPFVMVWPFVDLAWWQAFFPVGLFFLGLPIVWYAIKNYSTQSNAWPKVFTLWGNKEEGYPLWAEQQGISAWWWYAIRNPVNNKRYVFKEKKAPKVYGWQGPMEAQDLIREGVGTATRWTHSGWKVGYRKVWLEGNDKYSEVWGGWKLGSDVPGLGFTMQVRLKRKIGT